MLTEVDTRNIGRQSVSLFMDTDAQVYLVCVEGHEPITCLTRDRALNAFKHPYVYLGVPQRCAAHDLYHDCPNATDPPERRESDSNGTEGVDLALDTKTALISLSAALKACDPSDFQWITSRVAEIVQNIHRARFARPYDQDADIEF